jgi:AraC-like ligand binding domain
MPETLRGVDRDRLERSCGERRNTIRFGPGAPGLERAEVYLSTLAFEPHRHDTYALGVTTAGVQTFGYRGSRHVCLPGQLHFLYPDETHDGAAGTAQGFGYRILYLAPELVRDALDGEELPFVADPVQPRRRRRRSSPNYSRTSTSRSATSGRWRRSWPPRTSSDPWATAGAGDG